MIVTNQCKQKCLDQDERRFYLGVPITELSKHSTQEQTTLNNINTKTEVFYLSSLFSFFPSHWSLMNCGRDAQFRSKRNEILAYKIRSMISINHFKLACSSVLIVIIMARSIKLFHRIQKIYRTLGIESNPNCSLSKYRKFIVIMAIVSVLLALTTFILFDAETTTEYAACSSASIMVFAILCFFVINLFKINDITKLIQKFEDFIEMSEHFNHMV